MISTEKILVLVRATPEQSKKYGYKVCVAGINEKGDWRRLYPFKFSYGEKLIDFKKKDMITVEITEAENDKRLESKKVVGHKNLCTPLSDREVLKQIKPLVTSIECLDKDGSSLGVIKPILKKVSLSINDTQLYDEQAYLSLTGDFLVRKERVKMPVEVRYTFTCSSEPTCKEHTIILIDWELNELTRNILRKEKDKERIKQKIKQKFYDFMLQRDLYFFVGTHFRFGTWMIIGLFYPTKNNSEADLLHYI
jgi:hypothetical protein